MPELRIENVKGDRFDLCLSNQAGGITIPGVTLEEIEKLVENRRMRETGSIIEDPIALVRIDGSKLVKMLTRGVYYVVDPVKLQHELDSVTGARCRAYAPQEDGSHIRCDAHQGHDGEHIFPDATNQKVVTESVLVREITDALMERLGSVTGLTSEPSIPALSPTRRLGTELL